MIEAALEFEQTANQLAPMFLVGPGLAGVLIGLFIWLGGLGFRKILVAAIAGVIGGGLGFFMLDRDLGLAVAIGGGAAFVAMLLENVLVSGTGMWRFVCAVLCAGLGSALVFAGMILLLLYKGSAPVSFISQKQSFYISVFAAMTVFGTVEQLMFCKYTIKRARQKTEPEK